MITVKRVHKMGVLSMESQRAKSEIKISYLSPEQLKSLDKVLDEKLSPYEKHLKEIHGSRLI